MSDRLAVGSVWREDGETEWGVTPAHEVQVWDQGVLCVYPKAENNDGMI